MYLKIVCAALFLKPRTFTLPACGPWTSVFSQGPCGRDGTAQSPKKVAILLLKEVFSNVF